MTLPPTTTAAVLTTAATVVSATTAATGPGRAMAASVMAAAAASHVRRHSLAVTAGDPLATVPAALRRANGQASRAAPPRVAASRPLPSNTLQLPDLSAYPQSDASNSSQQSQHVGSWTEKQTAEGATASSSTPTTKRDFYANDVIERHAERQPHQISLRQLTSFGRSLSRDKILLSANFVKDELLVRLARRIHDFQRLPYIVGTNPHVAHAYSLYYDAFDALLSVPQIQTLDDNTAFCELLSALVDAHTPIVPHLAVGLCEVPASHFGPKETDRFMNVMVFSRIGRRVLAEHHLALTGTFSAPVGRRGSIHGQDSNAPRQMPDYQNYLNRPSSSPTQVGIVDGRCRASELVQHCGQQAAAWFADTFLDESLPGSAPAAPQVVVDGYHHALLSCIPSHAEYVLYELMKNAMAHTFRAADPEGYALWRKRRLAHQERQHSLEGETSGRKIPEELGRFTWNEPRFAWVPDRSTGDGSVTAESNPSSRKGTAAPLPPVQVTIGYLPPGHGRSSKTSSPRAAEVTFRVSDVGGGIPHTLLQDEESNAASSHSSGLAAVGPLQRWSTALDRRRRRTADGVDVDGSDASSGLSTGDRDEQGEWRPWLRRIHLLRHHIGLGLPMATAFARYWGGEVHLHSMHGFGTDAYYTLPAGEWAENMFWWEGRHRDARGD